MNEKEEIGTEKIRETKKKELETLKIERINKKRTGRNKNKTRNSK